MDREQVINLANQLYGMMPENKYHVLAALEEFLVEKGKDRDQINLFIKAMAMAPTDVINDYFKVALDYYMAKYGVFILWRQISPYESLRDTTSLGGGICRIIKIY